MNIYTPFTYLIGWSAINQWYYGVRYAKGCHPDDLWDTYFTSSKHVNSIRSLYGEPDVIQIRKTFSTAKEAQSWEHKVLKRLDVIHDPRFINKHNGTTPDYESAMRGARKSKPWSENDHRRKLSSERAYANVEHAKESLKLANTPEAKQKAKQTREAKISCMTQEDRRTRACLNHASHLQESLPSAKAQQIRL